MKVLTDNSKPKIYLLSDTHLIADELHDNGRAFQQMRDTSAGKDLDYQEIVLTTFVRKIITEKPTAVIITGDLTFNGEKLSAQRLAQIFAPLTKNRIQFLVIPGNHDIYDGWVRKFSGDTQARIDEISPQDWREIFSDSYTVADKIDPNSLSYSVNLNQNYRLIFADSNIYGNQYSLTHPITNGRLTHATLNWIEEELKNAQIKQQHVLFFMHHNLYRHNNVIHGGFVLDNAEDLQKLFQKYQVKIAFSGHIHAQNIFGPTKECPTTEVASSCFCMTDQGYGEISLSPNELSYQHQSFEMKEYLNKEEKEKLPSDFQKYLRQIFSETNQKQMTWLNEKITDKQKYKEILDLIDQLNWNFFVGRSNYSATEITKIKHSQTYQLIEQKLHQIHDYLDSLLSVKQDSQTLKIKY